tara:strand:- start:840 stop:1904 length:1065 start_codon:yes stop_codon:yes gene_type:complete
MKIAIIGGGINGLMIARQLEINNHDVSLFERDSLMCGTSSKSTKLLHGGIRYLEQFHFSQVKESLKERDFWLNYAPDLVSPLEIIIPIYKESYRKRWIYLSGLHLYNFLAGKRNIRKHQKYSKEELLKIEPSLSSEGLISGLSFFDAQMDDYKLGLFIADIIKDRGVKIFTNREVSKIKTDGRLFFNDQSSLVFDKIINASGPYAERLLKKSGIKCEKSIDLIRGSHIIFDEKINSSFLLESNDKRLFFVISYDNKTMVGTTEVRQDIDDRVTASKEEFIYLLNAYNKYFHRKKTKKDIIDFFSGVRPLIRSKDDPNQISREYGFEVVGNLVTVFGGKWTSSRSLAEKCSRLIG